MPPCHTTWHLSGWLLSKRIQIINNDKDVQRREPSCIVGRHVNWCSHYGENAIEVSQKKKLKVELPCVYVCVNWLLQNDQVDKI